jgi:hypothetical protein
MKIVWTMLPVSVAFVLCLLCRAAEQRLADQVEKVPDRAKELPKTIGDWEGEDIKMEQQQFEWAQLTGYLQRQYNNRATGDSATVLLVWGRPDPVTIHTPDQCYIAAGYKLEGGKTKKKIDLEGSGGQVEFWTGNFVKESAALPDNLRIFWDWSANGNWSAPDDARSTFARHRAVFTYGAGILFKLYIICPIKPRDVARGVDPNEEFAKILMPELQKVLFGTR